MTTPKNRHAGWAAGIAVLAVAIGSCAAPSTAQSSASTSSTTFAAVSVSPPASTSAAPASTLAPAGKSGSTEAGYLTLAKSAYPGRSSTELVATGKAICATLRTDPSLHDAVGTLSGQIQGQGSADELVRAAITAYCPDLTTR